MNTHQHGLGKFEEVEKKVKQAETVKIQAETKIVTLREQYQKVEKELMDMGVNPKEAEKEVETLNQEIENMFTEILALLPQENTL